MQTLCLLLPEPYATRVIQARALLAEDAALGRVHDPPFAHFTLQMAEEYDWPALEAALVEFARGQTPFAIRTVGLLTVTGAGTGITIEPYRDSRLAAFHADLWQVVTPCARGVVAPFYLPDRWVPHVTVKRCGPHREAFGLAMARLSDDDFIWSMHVETLSVQHDRDNNNLTRYQRLRVPLGTTPRAEPPLVRPPANAVIVDVREPAADDQRPTWRLSARRDNGSMLEVALSAPETVHLMADARAALPFFSGARCTVDDERLVSVSAATPFPVAY